MAMLHFAFCDDEPQALEQLSAQAAACMEQAGYPDYEISRFSNGQVLLESGRRFDAVFLDVQMGPPDGLETAEALRRRGDTSLVIFLTVLRERVYDAFAVQAFDYLLKPVDPDRLRRTLDRALAALNRRPQSLVVQRGSVREVIPLDEILYCEVLGRKIYIHRRDGSVAAFCDKLEALERRLGDGFFRCHRSYLVNLDWIRGCGGGQAALDGGASIPVSRLRERDLTAALLRRMSGRS